MSKTLDTNLTVEEIQWNVCNAIANFRTDIIIPNLSWGMLNYEADLVIINKSHYMTEVEIKRSFSDLKADFKKAEMHNDERVRELWYALPASIEEKAMQFFQQKEIGDKCRKMYNDYRRWYPAILWYDEHGSIKKNYQCPYTGKGRKLFLEEVVKISRLISIRYWEKIFRMNLTIAENAKQNGAGRDLLLYNQES